MFVWIGIFWIENLEFLWCSFSSLLQVVFASRS